jgi:uroporphyrinogen decarboxylase
MVQMSKRERLKSVLSGKPVDRLPIAFWRHWPGDDQHMESLAAVALDFQQRYDLDFIKLPVSSTYTVTDYGVKHEYQGSLMGDRVYQEYVIKNIEDWDRIKPLDVNRGAYGWHLEALRMIIKHKKPETPVIVTMFNPLSVAAYLAGDNTCLSHLRSHPERVEPAIKALAETSANFARETINAGADGIFLSTRFASFEIMNEHEYNLYGRPGDLEVLQAAKNGWFNILHVHGQHPMLTKIADYPVQALNWHDRTTPFDLTEGSRLFSGVLMGGIEQYKTLRFGSQNDVISQVQDAIRQTNGRKLVVTPGCTYPLDVPHANLLALRKAVDTLEIRTKSAHVS